MQDRIAHITNAYDAVTKQMEKINEDAKRDKDIEVQNINQFVSCYIICELFLIGSRKREATATECYS